MVDLNNDCPVEWMQATAMDRKYFHKCNSYLVNAMGILKDIYRVDDFELFYKKKEKKIQLLLLSKFVTVGKNEIIRWVDDGIIVDTTFKKYGLNNVQIWSTGWVSNSGKVENSFLVPKFLKHCYFQAKCLLRFN